MRHRLRRPRLGTACHVLMQHTSSRQHASSQAAAPPAQAVAIAAAAAATYQQTCLCLLLVATKSGAGTGVKSHHHHAQKGGCEKQHPAILTSSNPVPNVDMMQLILFMHVNIYPYLQAPGQAHAALSCPSVNVQRASAGPPTPSTALQDSPCSMRKHSSSRA